MFNVNPMTCLNASFKPENASASYVFSGDVKDGSGRAMGHPINLLPLY